MTVKRTALIVRYGAFGDGIIMTPVIRKLKQMGYYVIANVSDRCMAVLKDNKNVDEFLYHETDSVACDKLTSHWLKLLSDIKPDKYINLSESLECKLALSPKDPAYIYSKQERIDLCSKNYYEETFKSAGLDYDTEDLMPELFFDSSEIDACGRILDKDKFNILWCLSGSNKHKAYPYVETVIEEILDNNKNVRFITVGDDSCSIIEPKIGHAVTNLCGKISMRISLALTKHVDLVVSPDTGVLHASGCFDTPKIGLLGHTNIENITKHFKNDYSIESTSPCSPCFRLIYDHTWQCPVDYVTGGCVCQAIGIPPETVVNQIQKVIDERCGNQSNRT